MPSPSFAFHILSTLAVGLASTVPAAAQVTTAQVALGGNGGWSTDDGCQRTKDPPELSDGTIATGMLTFRYDQSTHQLRVTVDNTSPVTTGVPNPLMTAFYFNIPANTMTSITLDAQAGQGPALPQFGMRLNPSPVGCLGSFTIEMLNSPVLDDIKGAIANPAADTHSAPPNSWVNSPVHFDFTITGPGANLLNANAIANSFAQNSGTGVQATAAAHFQAGQAGGSAKIAGGGGCRTSIYTEGDVHIGQGVTICVGGAAGCHGCLFGSFNGTPFMFNNVLVPIGLPFAFVAALPPFNQGRNAHCFRAIIPNDPNLINVPFYMTVGTFDANLNLEFSPQFVFVFQP
jgi:hypothetical protein